MKPGIRIDIPGFGRLELTTLVSDYTGTLARGGKVSAGLERQIVQVSELLEIHVLTADTLGTVEREIGHLPLTIHRLAAERQDEQKRVFADGIPAARVAAFGNGNNDRLMLRTVRQAGGLAIAVDNGEGCALDSLQNASLLIAGIENGLDLLLETGRLIATLRF